MQVVGLMDLPQLLYLEMLLNLFIQHRMVFFLVVVDRRGGQQRLPPGSCLSWHLPAVVRRILAGDRAAARGHNREAPCSHHIAR